MTAGWYKSVLEKLPENSHVLDIGIGTGGALVKNTALIQKKKLKITGIDYDADYVVTCKKVMESAGLQANTGAIVHASVYDYQGGPFDAAYFSGSLMIMPDPVAALVHVAGLLKPGGKIYVTQTFEKDYNVVLSTIKPLLKYLLTIDFGKVTYEKDFIKDVESAHLKIASSVGLSVNHGRESKLFVLTKPN